MQYAFAAYITEMTKMPDLLDEGFYFGLLYFIDSQFHPINEIMNKASRNMRSVEYLPRYRAIWSLAHTGLCRFDPKITTKRLIAWAKACLMNIDRVDDVWLPPSILRADANENFEKWAETFNPNQSFFDDDIIVDLIKFLPAPQKSGCKRVRRVLWKWSQRRSYSLKDPEQQGVADEMHRSNQTIGGMDEQWFLALRNTQPEAQTMPESDDGKTLTSDVEATPPCRRALDVLVGLDEGGNEYSTSDPAVLFEPSNEA